MYSWQVHVTTLPEDLSLYRMGKLQTVRIELLHCGFSIKDFTSRFDNLFAVAHPKTHAATLFRLKYAYAGLDIKRC